MTPNGDDALAVFREHFPSPRREVLLNVETDSSAGRALPRLVWRATANADTVHVLHGSVEQQQLPNSAGPPTGPSSVDYASATQATVTVTLTDPGRNIFFNQGGPAADGDSFEFNLPAGDFTITPLTAGFVGDYTPPSNLYGDFTYGVDCSFKGGACQNANDPELTSLMFTISSIGSTPINFTDTGNVLFSRGRHRQHGC